MAPRQSAPVVAVLAGGRGSRLGGDKAMVELGGRPLIVYPLESARAAGLDAVVAVKRSTRLPPVDVPLLIEPDEPIHPLLGIVTALGRFPAIIALPCDMPFVAPAQLMALAATDADIATVSADQRFPSLYRRPALPRLREALALNQPMRAAQARALLAPAAASSRDPVTQISVNNLADLAAAERELADRG